MICPNCGTQLEDNTAFCTQCGSNVQSDVSTDTAYDVQTPAYNAEPVVENTEPEEVVQDEVSPKSRTAALILAIVLGGLGINRFYLGKKGGVSRLIMYIIGMICSSLSAYIVPLAFVALPLLIIVLVGAIKDIIRTAKGTMTDGQDLPVTKW